MADAQKKVLTIDPEMTLIFGELASPLESDEIEWRIDGKPQADGTARFVPYARANAVRKRLDSVVPGRWSLALEALPVIGGEEPYGFKATLTIELAATATDHYRAVVRSDVGTGKDYKSASTDAFKRVAVRFGVGHELYDMGALMVPVNGYKPACDPKAWYDYVYNDGPKPALSGEAAFKEKAAEVETVIAKTPSHGQISAAKSMAAMPDPYAVPSAHPEGAPILPFDDEPECPKCGGPMWDERPTKRNPKAPDFKCKKKGVCDGVIWPPRK